MSVRGIAAGPDQIADGIDPTLLAEVNADKALRVQGGSTDPAGTIQNVRVDSDGRMVMSSADMIRELLIEMRLLTEIFAESHFITDIEFRRADIDKDLGF